MNSHLRAVPMADSGNETLASDESPPPLSAPPRIQPCSGVLANGKVVIRPIAFKPGGATRLCNAGERYGSTPVLASRPGSHATTYGSSSDLRGPAPRPLERQPASLSSLPARPPHPQTMTTASYGSSGGADGGGSLSQLAPSPADSGVAELEAARLASDLADPATFSIAPHSRCERGAVRAERRRVGEAGARAAQLAAAARRDADALRARLEDAEWTLCRRSGELALVKTQLKERQNELTTKGHEYLQLKGEYRQVRESFERKEMEVSKLQSENEEKDKTVKQLKTEVNRLNSKLAASESELSRNKEQSGQEIDRLKSELKELREELSDVSLSGYEGIESGRSMRGIYDMCKNSNEYHWNSNDSSLEDAEVQRLNGELPDLPCAERCQANALIHRLKCEIETKENEFNKERRKWSEEKEKVLRYQKQLQLNYVQMFRRSRNLEAEVESLRLELELCNKNMKNLGKLGKTIEL